MDKMEYRNWVASKLNIGKEVLYLTKDECVNSGITFEEIIEMTERSLVAHGKKELDMPAKIGLHPYHNTFMHAMPCYIPSEFTMGIKWGGCFPENRTKFGLTQLSGLYITNDPETGWPLAIMDCIWLTAMRTPAVTAVAAKYMTFPDKVATFGMIGCGAQGYGHIQYVPKTLPNLKKIFIYDVFEPAMDRVVNDLQATTQAKIVKCKSLEELVKSSEAIASATIITAQPEPKIKDEWISKGQTILMCDCHSLYEDKTMKRADKYYVDSIDQHTLLAGYGYYPDGLPEVFAETGEVVAGLKKGRDNSEQLIVDNNVGLAAEDIPLARAIFDKALQTGTGRKLPL